MDATHYSMLDRLQNPADVQAWQKFCDLYEPFIRGLLLRDPTLRNDVDDLVQEVLKVVVVKLPEFHRERTGSFRAWLRTITVHRLQDYWRARQRQPTADAASDSVLVQLADPQSDLSRQWDEEHDRHVVLRLLDFIDAQFEPATVQAFRRTFFDGKKAAKVAEELGMTENAVLIAKSRVLKRLREEGEGLLG